MKADYKRLIEFIEQEKRKPLYADIRNEFKETLLNREEVGLGKGGIFNFCFGVNFPNMAFLACIIKVLTPVDLSKSIKLYKCS